MLHGCRACPPLGSPGLGEGLQTSELIKAQKPIFLYLFCTGNHAQDLALARQALALSYIPALFFCIKIMGVSHLTPRHLHSLCSKCLFSELESLHVSSPLSWSDDEECTYKLFLL